MEHKITERHKVLLYELGKVNIKDGRTIDFFKTNEFILGKKTEYSYRNPTQVRTEINEHFHRQFCTTTDLIGKKGQSRFVLNCTKYKEPIAFTYIDFFDIFLSPLSKVKIKGQVIEKNALSEEEKIAFFFSLAENKNGEELTGTIYGADVSQKRQQIYRFFSNNNGERLDDVFEKVKGKLKGCIVAEDLIPFDISSGITPEETAKILDVYQEKKKNWEEKNNIFTEEKYPTENLCGLFDNDTVKKFIPAEWSNAICNISDTNERFRKWDDFIVGLYFIALAEYKSDDESRELKKSQEDFTRILKRKLRILFDPDYNTPDRLIKEIIQRIQLIRSMDEISLEERSNLISLLLNDCKINDNQFEQTHDPIKRK